MGVARHQERRIEELEQKLEVALHRIGELEAELAKATTRIQEQERELKEWREGHRVRDKRYPDREAKDATAPPRPPGRPAGHPGAGRPRPKEQEISRRIELKPDDCGHCRSAAVRLTGKTRVTPVEELVAKKEVVGYVQYEVCCLCCGAVTWAELPAALGPSPKLGPQAQAIAMELRNDVGLTFGKLQRTLDVFGLHLTKGALQQMAIRTAQRTQPAFGEIIERARQARVLGMDETGWRHAGHKAWGWLARTDEFSLFIISPSRAHEVVVELLGEDFGGTLVVDFYAAYGAYGRGLRQFCWSHLIREARKIAQLAPCPETRRFLVRVRAAYQRGLALQQLIGRPGWLVGDHVMRTSLGRLIADPALGAHADVARLQARMAKHFQGLLQFTREAEVPGTNNGSEQDMRFHVIFRKTSFCTRSDVGAATLAQLTSISHTLRKQGGTWRGFLPAALAAFWSGGPPPSVFTPRPAGCRGENATRTPVAAWASPTGRALPTGFIVPAKAGEAALPN